MTSCQSHLISEEAEAQIGWVSCPEPHGWQTQDRLRRRAAVQRPGLLPCSPPSLFRFSLLRASLVSACGWSGLALLFYFPPHSCVFGQRRELEGGLPSLTGSLQCDLSRAYSLIHVRQHPLPTCLPRRLPSQVDQGQYLPLGTSKSPVRSTEGLPRQGYAATGAGCLGPGRGQGRLQEHVTEAKAGVHLPLDTQEQRLQEGLGCRL